MYTIFMSLDAVIIDFDDTLVMTELACFVLENEALRRMGRQPMSRETHVQTWGMQIADAILLRSPGINVNEYLHVANQVHQEMVDAGEIDVVSAENIATLTALLRHNLQLFILTSRTEDECRHLLDPLHNLSDKFVHIYHAGNTSHIKPDPRVFDALLQEYSLTPDTCVYVGDSPSDGIADNKAGMKFIACFESGLRTPDDFKDISVGASIDRFTELTTAIQLVDQDV